MKTLIKITRIARVAFWVAAMTACAIILFGEVTASPASPLVKFGWWWMSKFLAAGIMPMCAYRAFTLYTRWFPYFTIEEHEDCYEIKKRKEDAQ